ncbi:anti-sigma factor RsbA family regulatory protein [Nocardioides currus]|uniref:Anti-sigma regulatory factor n=1 Tax=Nocardioides currus TaxID=2133958 RepID=A0A2R7YY37_9ACTN|nr:anti-sigma factor RsbA family regulatory protein [Nocardioides currus]PUA81305.1 hypothetical protein C7S10_09795 [Nocardioides currus]
MTTATGATHTSVFYDGSRQYAAEVGGYLRDGLARGRRGLVMAPPRRVDELRATLGRDADEVTFVEDTIAYEPQWNAYRVLRDFAATAGGARSCVVAEQRLAERIPAEVVDYGRLEAAAGVVFADFDVDLLCPYDAGTLPPHLLDIGLHAHAVVRSNGESLPNSRFEDPFDVLAGLSVVSPPPPEATSIDCSAPTDVAQARRLVRARGAEAGLRPDVVSDITLAVSEVLTNSIMHGESPTLLHLYTEGDTWVCHVHDGGRAPLDPLVGLLPPAEPSDHGYGLWLARQLCTAVDVGTDRSGTHVRLHMRMPRADHTP